MVDAMSYELLIRRAFSLVDPDMHKRWGDPASMANAGYADALFDKPVYKIEAKSAIIYSMCIFKSKLETRMQHGEMSEGDFYKIQDEIFGYIKSVDSAKTSKEFLAEIELFFENIIHKHFSLEK